MNALSLRDIIKTVKMQILPRFQGMRILNSAEITNQLGV